MVPRKDIVKKAKQGTEDSANAEPRKVKVEYDWKNTVSTGSTLLDLAISGGRCHTGGIPGGIFVEIFGRSSSGKSSILSEIGAAARNKGGVVYFLDPEARLDQEYCETYGLKLDPKEYGKPDTVEEVFQIIKGWAPDNKKSKINTMCIDSLAALTTELEVTKGDKMGMRRAKEFSTGFRTTCRTVEENGWLIACSNQIRQGDFGDIAPGGKAIEFYSSLRVKIMPAKVRDITRTKKVMGIDHTEVIGVRSMCTIVKSSVDNPFRTAPINIIFGYGIDDVMANLQFIKDNTLDESNPNKPVKRTKYWCVNAEWMAMDKAIKHIEDNNLENDLKEKVIEIWNAIRSAFQMSRKVKTR